MATEWTPWIHVHVRWAQLLPTQLMRFLFVINCTMKIIRPIIYVLLIAVSALAASAAPVKIHGQITDENNDALEFVTIKVEGTAIGATSDLDGKYSLSVAEADTIRLSFTCQG